jgi:hypothetical protein
MKVGDTIEVVALLRDPLPPPVGARGTITEITPAVVNADDNIHYKAYVKWADGVFAVGALLIPEDSYTFRVVPA